MAKVHTLGGRELYGVLSTIVVQVETFAAARSEVDGVVHRALSMIVSGNGHLLRRFPLTIMLRGGCGGPLWQRGHTLGGRVSYGVLSTIVVRVETFAAARIRARSTSRADGVATRTFRM